MHAVAHRLLLSASAWLLVAGFSVGAESEPSPPLNVVLISADDLGYADLGFQGSADIPTPQLDALARGGVRCTAAYAAAPVGGPSRAALATGRYPQRFGFEFNAPRTGSEAYGLPAAETIIAEFFKRAGYATGLVGKWQLGNTPPRHPQRRGFDEFFGFLDAAQPYLPSGELPPGQAGSVPRQTPWPVQILRGSDLVEEREYLTDAFTREAVDFIGCHGNERFFLWLSYNAPHTPIEAPSKYLDRVYGVTGGDHHRRIYAAMLTALDDGVGQVVAALRKRMLTERTLIVFCSDNGGITGYLSPSNNAPLSGTKGELLEGGIRVPLVFSQPGKLPGRAVYPSAVSLLDIAPTVLSLAGIAAAGSPAFDGVDLSPQLAAAGGPNLAPQRPPLYWRYGSSWAVRSGSYKLLQMGHEVPQLYDLDADPAERRDLAAAHPEIVGKLTPLWQSWNQTLAAPAWNAPNSPPWW